MITNLSGMSPQHPCHVYCRAFKDSFNDESDITMNNRYWARLENIPSGPTQEHTTVCLYINRSQTLWVFFFFLIQKTHNYFCYGYFCWDTRQTTTLFSGALAELCIFSDSPKSKTGSRSENVSRNSRTLWTLSWQLRPSLPTLFLNWFGGSQICIRKMRPVIAELRCCIFQTEKLL